MMDFSEILSNVAEEVDYSVFYRDVFPEGSLEKKGEHIKGMYHAVAISVAKNGKKVKRFSVTDDLDVLDQLVKTDDFCLMSPISYAGLSRKSDMARFLYAIAIDLDGVDSRGRWDYFWGQICDGYKLPIANWALPMPTYLVSSGTGLHLYYVFEKPVPLFQNVVKQLEAMKRRLTWKAWTQGASCLSENIQYESLYQGFRVVGTITKNGARARAFRTGEKVTLDFLNEYLQEEYQVKTFKYTSSLRLSDAKNKYPEWYEKRIIKGLAPGNWTCKRDLYDWWKRRAGEVLQGHRYWYIMTLATYAVKCGISQEELEKDALELIPLMNSKGDLFDENDVVKALEAFSESYHRYPIKTIVNRTGLPIERNKRNGRRQIVHLAGARAVQAVNDQFNGTNWRNTQGQPKKNMIVYEWRRAHPEGLKIDCERETGLSRPTIIKWWDWRPEIEE